MIEQDKISLLFCDFENLLYKVPSKSYYLEEEEKVAVDTENVNYEKVIIWRKVLIFLKIDWGNVNWLTVSLYFYENKTIKFHLIKF